MGLEQRYLEAVLGVRRLGTAAGELTPAVLAAAAVAVLPVSAAGISLSQARLRVPLGWSDQDAATAERHQTTLGDGPCLTAAATGRSLVADAAAIAERWPAYWAELEQSTPFRSVAAVPLRVPGEPAVAALDLYADRPDLEAVLNLDEAETVAAATAGLLFGMLDEAYYGADEPPGWVDDQPAIDRLAVWTAVGMLTSATDLVDVDALARLRAFAYASNLTLDEAAARLVDRRLPVQAVLA